MSGITIHVAGVPRPLPRPRFVNGRAVAIADKKARAWKMAVEAASKRALAAVPSPVLGAARVRCSFYMPTAKAERWGQPHTARPDADNLAKMALDCLERAGVLPKGDAVVAQLQTDKLWARAGGAVIEVRPWQEKAPRAG